MAPGHQHLHHHHGAHDHKVGHEHTEQDGNLEDMNKKAFDGMAKTYESPAALYLTENLADAIYERYLRSANGQQLTLLDYACGPGTISYRLLEQERVGKIVGADVSTGMVSVFNDKATAKGYSPDQAKAVTVTKHGLQDSLNGHLFDFVMCNHAYHHFDDVQGVTAKLATALKPGGQLIVADWLTVEGSASGNDEWVQRAKEHGVKHTHGFTANTLTAHFEAAGLQDVRADATLKISKKELVKLGANDTPLKNIIGDMEEKPDINYLLVVGTKA